MGSASRQSCGRFGVVSLGAGKLLAAAVALCLCLAGATAASGLSAQRAYGAELTDAQVQQRIEAGSLGFFKSLGAKGEKAVELLIRNISEPELTKQELILPVTLVERGSVKRV